MGELIGYARVSTSQQDVASQREALERIGISPTRIYIDEGFTARNRDRPGLEKAQAAVRDGDTLVVTKLDRLARSVPDAHAIVADLTARGVKLRIGDTVHDPKDPMSKLLLNVLAMIGEFEADLISARTREGMALARKRGRLKGKPPKLSKTQEAHLVDLYNSGEHTTTEIAELFNVGRATVYRALKRAAAPPRGADAAEKVAG